jgi:hypothetical protein
MTTGDCLTSLLGGGPGYLFLASCWLARRPSEEQQHTYKHNNNHHHHHHEKGKSPTAQISRRRATISRIRTKKDSFWLAFHSLLGVCPPAFWAEPSPQQSYRRWCCSIYISRPSSHLASDLFFFFPPFSIDSFAFATHTPLLLKSLAKIPALFFVLIS